MFTNFITKLPNMSSTVAASVMTKSVPTLLNKNQTIIDKIWIKNAQINRRPINVYDINKMNNMITIRTLKGPNVGMASMTHKMDDGSSNMAISKAGTRMNINVPEPGKGYEQLVRDYLMLKDAEQLYLVGDFSTDRSRLQLYGQEGWMGELFVDMLETKNPKIVDYPIYFYCISFQFWCKLYKINEQEGGTSYTWIKISRPPRPSGPYVGSGGNIASNTINLEVQMV